MAEREGFEPSVPLLTAHTISSRAPSASSVISPFLSHSGGITARSLIQILIQRPESHSGATALIGSLPGNEHPMHPNYLAERVGFEPTIPFLTGYRFSRAGPSAARPPLLHPPLHIRKVGLIAFFPSECQPRYLGSLGLCLP